MNKIKGEILKIESCGELSSVKIKSKSGAIFSSLMLDIDSFGVEIGEEINMLFKENEVLIATKESVLSARNAFVCRVCKINKGELLSEVGFEFEDGVVSSIITTDSLMRLGVKEGSEFMWFVKANEVTLQRGKNV